jgi:hypothetical protein
MRVISQKGYITFGSIRLMVRILSLSLPTAEFEYAL